MGYLALVSARRGLGAGLLTVVGVTLGLAAHLIAAAAGLSQMAVGQPVLYQALRWGGVAYLLWLAFDAWRSRTTPTELDQAGQGDWRDVRRGFLTNVLNPKALIFYLTVIPSFVPPDATSGPRAVLTLGALHLAVSVAIHLGLGGLEHARRLRRPQPLRMLDQVLTPSRVTPKAPKVARTRAR